MAIIRIKKKGEFFQDSPQEKYNKRKHYMFASVCLNILLLLAVILVYIF